MFRLKSDKVIFVDVDDTLVMWNKTNTEYTPHEQHILMIKKFHKRGQKVIVWSAGGWKWASYIVKELNLEPYVFMVCSKPAWFIDDLPASEFMPEINRIYIHQEPGIDSLKVAFLQHSKKYKVSKEEVSRKRTRKAK